MPRLQHLRRKRIPGVCLHREREHELQRLRRELRNMQRTGRHSMHELRGKQVPERRLMHRMHGLWCGHVPVGDVHLDDEYRLQRV